MTIYTGRNAAGSKVYDVEARRELKRVVSVDTETGVVTMHCDPVRLNDARTKVVTYEARFKSIYPIFGGRTKPVLFHCYGRIQRAAPDALPAERG